MATLEEIQPHRISLRPRVVLESPKALMSSKYLCGMARPDSSHIVHEVQIQDQHGELQRIRALIDCGATSIFISSRLLNRLGLPHEAAHIRTHGLDGQVIAHARESRKTAMTVQYNNHLAPVSVSNGSGPSLRVRVRVQTEPLPNWRSGSSINPNCPLGYSSIVNSQPVRVGRVFSGLPSGSIYRFI